jgi:hypothetical protein
MTTVKLNKLYADTTKRSELENYIQNAINLAGQGKDIILAGVTPIWLYLSVVHVLHGQSQNAYLSVYRITKYR